MRSGPPRRCRPPSGSAPRRGPAARGSARRRRAASDPCEQPPQVRARAADSADGATGPSARNRSSPPGTARSASLQRRRPPGGRRRRRQVRRARARGSDRARPRRRDGARAARPAPRASAQIPSCASTSAMSGSCFARPAKIRSDSSSDCSTSRGTSVSSAISKPGSRSASSGNSRSSDRQNASIVLIEMSREPIAHLGPARLVELRLRGRAPQLADDALAHLRRGLARERDREDVAGLDAAPSAGSRSAQTSTDVLPVPAEASSTTLLRGSIAKSARRVASAPDQLRLALQLGAARSASASASAALRGSHPDRAVSGPNSDSCDVGARSACHSSPT